MTQRWHDFFDRTVANMVLRLVVMLVGLAFVAASVALTRASGLGTSPISCIPATLSYMTPLTIGAWTFVLNVGFVLVQVALLRREFQPIQFLQIPFVFVFSALIDLFVPVFELLPMSHYVLQLFWSVLGCFMTAFGVFLQVKACILTLPGEGIVLAVSKVAKVAFPKCKIAFDSSMVAIATVMSLAVLGGFYGVREGTIISAVCVGAIVGLYNKAFPGFERFCPIQGHITLTASTMDGADASKAAPASGTRGEQPVVITIAREYGSGGREIGQLVGRALGVPVYDTSLVTLTARDAGLTVDFVRSHEEEVRRGLVYNLYMQNYQVVGENPDAQDGLWLAQARTITRLADAGSCVIVGRCANAILSQRPHVFNVFIHAPLARRVERVVKRDGQDAQGAAAKIERIDAERAEHCRRCTGTVWGAPDGYHLSIDSSIASPAQVADFIRRAVAAAYPDAPIVAAEKIR